MAWRHGRAAPTSSGVKRCTHRYTVTWSTSIPRSASSSSTSRYDKPYRRYGLLYGENDDLEREADPPNADFDTARTGPLEIGTCRHTHLPRRLCANATEPIWSGSQSGEGSRARPARRCMTT